MLYPEKPLPHITPHVCRHTFCTNMAGAGMDPKVLQYIMGHSEIEVTMNVYTHFSAGYFFVRTEETLFTIDMINERIVEEWNCLCEDLKE